MYLSWIVLIVSLTGCYLHPLDSEPMCTSRFDFEEKLLDKVIRMEIMMEAMKNRVDGDLQKFGKDNGAFTLEFDNMRKEMGQTITDLKASYGELEEKADVKLTEMGGILDTKVAEMSQAITDLKASYGDLEEKADVTLTEMGGIFDTKMAEMGQTITDLMESYGDLEDKADVKLTEFGGILDTNVAEMRQKMESYFKPDVVFHVKDIDGQPNTSSIIKFTTVVENTNNVYDLDTGCFTAPMRGTYWFSAQLCTHTTRRMSPSLYVQNTLVNRKYIWDKDYGACGSVATVAVLHVNDIVCLKAGPYDNSSPVWSDNNYNTNSFMPRRN